MNFRWSNICVLQCLVVLNVNGLKLVPADRTVIKQNGTTRTISRYYLLPQTEDETQVNTVDSSASNGGDADFSKFLREFNPKRKFIKTKRRPPPRKKTIERYRIYIKRKLRKPKKKGGSKSPKGKSKQPKNIPTDDQPVTKIVKKRRPITYPTDGSDNSTAPPSISYVDSGEDDIGNKSTDGEASPQHKAKEIPKEEDIDPAPSEIPEPEVTKPDPENLENNDNDEIPEPVEEDEPVLRTKDSGYSAVEENAKDEIADQNFSDILPERTTPINNRHGGGKQPISSEEAVKVTTPSEGIGFNETPPEPLRAEVNMPEVTTIARTLINNDLLPEETTQNFDNATTDTIFYSGLSTNVYSKTVRSPPSNSQESTEYFDNITNLDYNQGVDNQANITVNPIYEEYILTTTEATATTIRPVHKLYNIASTEYSEAAVNNFTNQYLNQDYENKYFPGINQTDFEFSKNNESSAYNGYNISRTEIPYYNEGFGYAETTTSYQSPPDSLGDYATYTEHSKNGNETTFGDYNTQDKQNEIIMNPSYLSNNKTGMEYTQYSPANLGEYQSGGKYTNNIVTPIYTEHNQVNTGQPLNLSQNEYNQIYYPEYSQTRYPPSFGNNQAGGEYTESIKKISFNIGFTGQPESIKNNEHFDINRRPPSFDPALVKNSQYMTHPPYADYNQLSTEHAKSLGSPIYMQNNVESETSIRPQQLLTQETTEYSKTAKYPSYLSYSQENYEYSRTVRNPAYVGYYQEHTEYKDNIKNHLAANQVSNGQSGVIKSSYSSGSGFNGNGAGNEYSKYINKPQYTGHGTGSLQNNPPYSGYSQSNNGNSEGVVTPHTGQASAEYSTYTKYPDNAMGTDTEYTKYGNNSQYTGHGAGPLQNIQSSGGNNQLNNENLDAVVPPHTGQESTKYSTYTKYPDNATESDNQYSKYIIKPQYTGHGSGPLQNIQSSNGNNQLNNENSDTVITPHIGQPSAEYSTYTKYPDIATGIDNQYSKYGNNPQYTGHGAGPLQNIQSSGGNNQLNNENSDAVVTPHTGQPSAEYLTYTKYPDIVTGIDNEYSKYGNNPLHTGHGAGPLQNIQSSGGNNQLNNENSDAVVTPHIGQPSAEYSTYTKYPDIATVTDNEYSKYGNNPQYTGHGAGPLQNIQSAGGNNELNNENSDAVVTPPTGQTSAEYSTYTKYPNIATGADNEYSKYSNNPQYTGHGAEPLQNIQLSANNQLNNENLDAVVTDAQYLTDLKYPTQTPVYEEYKHSPTVQNMPYLSDNDASTEQEKPIKSPPIIGYYQESSETKEAIKYNPAFDFDLGGMEYSEPITSKSHSVFNKPIEKYSENIIKPQTIGNNQAASTVQKMKFSPYNSHQQSHIYKYSQETRFPTHGIHHQWQYFEFPENIKSSPFGIHQQSQSVEFSENSKYPLNSIHPSLQNGEKTSIASNGINQQPSSFEYSAGSKNPSHTIHLQPHDVEYTSKPKFTDLPAQSPPSGYAEISINQPYVGNSPLLNGDHSKISNEPQSNVQDNSQIKDYNEVSRTASSTDYSDTTTNMPFVLSDDYMPTARSIAYPTTTEISHKQNQNEGNSESDIGNGYEKQTEMEGNSNVIDIGNGKEQLNHLVNPDNITETKDKVPNGREENLPLVELLKKTLPNMKDQNQNYYSNIGGTSMEGVHIHTVVDLLKQLQNHQHPQPIHSNPYKDEDLHKILNYIIKGDAEAASHNVKVETVPSIQLFTIENLKNVLQSFDALKLSGINKETANLYNIMKLILETAQMQTTNEGDSLWYKQLPFTAGNPLKNYVYNLLHQTWLQEILSQLVNNDFNLNVINNPRWAAYLGAWHLPVQFTNGNSQYYDQDDNMLQYLHEHGTDVYNKLSDLQGDASAIFLLIQKYLLNSEINDGGIEYYLRQLAVFKRITAFLRERGYPFYVIDALIRKLYIVLNSSGRTNVIQGSQPGMCLAGH